VLRFLLGFGVRVRVCVRVRFIIRAQGFQVNVRVRVRDSIRVRVVGYG